MSHPKHDEPTTHEAHATGHAVDDHSRHDPASAHAASAPQSMHGNVAAQIGPGLLQLKLQRRAQAHAAGSHSHGGIPGGARNATTDPVNQGHRAGGLSTHLGIGGHDPVIGNKPTEVYGNDGKMLAHLGAGTSVSVNSGQICDLSIHGARTTCVFAHGSQPGWVPLAAFVNHGEIGQLQTRMASQIDQQRNAKSDLKHHGTKHTVYQKPAPSHLDTLFTKPNQHSSGANHVHDYYVRGHGTVNLLLNIPTWTPTGGDEGQRFGFANDLIVAAPLNTAPGAEPASSHFYQIAGPTEVPLFHQHSTKRVGHLNFVYGYVINNAGEKRLGWVNQDLLKP